jgi:hypothetical protein
LDGAGGETKVNANGYDLCSIFFRNIKGYSKFGSYKEMEMQMEHLFIQDLNQLGLWLKEVILQKLD